MTETLRSRLLITSHDDIGSKWSVKETIKNKQTKTSARFAIFYVYCTHELISLNWDATMHILETLMLHIRMYYTLWAILIHQSNTIALFHQRTWFQACSYQRIHIIIAITACIPQLRWLSTYPLNPSFYTKLRIGVVNFKSNLEETAKPPFPLNHLIIFQSFL